MQASFLLFVGIDWATENHQVCVLDREGEPVAERQVRHSGSGIQEFISWLDQHTGVPAEQVAVAIEMPSGAIIETLVEHNYQAFSLNPKQLDRFRDRHTVAGAKDDRRDAFVLADSLRTDLHCFHRIRLDDPKIIRILTLSRLEDSLLQDWFRLTNQLREHLHRYFPQILELSPAADEVWVWAYWRLLPCRLWPASSSGSRWTGFCRGVAFAASPQSTLSRSSKCKLCRSHLEPRKPPAKLVYC